MIFIKHKNKDVKVSGALIYGKLMNYINRKPLVSFRRTQTVIEKENFWCLTVADLKKFTRALKWQAIKLTMKDIVCLLDEGGYLFRNPVSIGYQIKVIYKDCTGERCCGSFYCILKPEFLNLQ